MKTILFTNARDETNILEWTIHHLNLKFDTIYIYDHISKIKIKSIIEKCRFTKKANVIVDELNTNKINKKILLNKALKYSKNHNYEWMLYLDADEFLILPNDENIIKFIKKYIDYQQICINWLIFGSNYLENAPNGTILENYTRCDNILNRHVKPIIKVTKSIEYINPHICKSLNPKLIIDVNYNNLDENNLHFSNLEYDKISNINKLNAYIAHYQFQSYETYIKRKIFRNRDDGGGKWDNYDRITLHSISNNTHNFFPKNKYNNNNKKYL